MIIEFPSGAVMPHADDARGQMMSHTIDAAVAIRGGDVEAAFEAFDAMGAALEAWAAAVLREQAAS